MGHTDRRIDNANHFNRWPLRCGGRAKNTPALNDVISQQSIFTSGTCRKQVTAAALFALINIPLEYSGYNIAFLVHDINLFEIVSLITTKCKQKNYFVEGRYFVPSIRDIDIRPFIVRTTTPALIICNLLPKAVIGQLYLVLERHWALRI